MIKNYLSYCRPASTSPSANGSTLPNLLRLRPNGNASSPSAPVDPQIPSFTTFLRLKYADYNTSCVRRHWI